MKNAKSVKKKFDCTQCWAKSYQMKVGATATDFWRVMPMRPSEIDEIRKALKGYVRKFGHSDASKDVPCNLGTPRDHIYFEFAYADSDAIVAIMSPFKWDNLVNSLSNVALS